VLCGLRDKPHLLAKAAAELRLAAAHFLLIYLKILNFSMVVVEARLAAGSAHAVEGN
jgi:hypothetical protein